MPEADDILPGSFTLRAACKSCGSLLGYVTTKGNQDCVYCDCGKFQYNAPKTETGREVRSVSTVHKGIKSKRIRILLRANGHCELCGRHEELHVGHLISVDHGIASGMTDIQINDEENLAAMCAECNLGLGKQPVTLRFAVSLVMARLKIKRDNPLSGEDEEVPI